MHGLDTLPALTATFASLDDEEADYDAVKALYHDGHLIDGSDAVGTAKNGEGKAAIVKKQEQPLRQGAWVDGALVLATGPCRPLHGRRHRCWVGRSAGGLC